MESIALLGTIEETWDSAARKGNQTPPTPRHTIKIEHVTQCDKTFLCVRFLTPRWAKLELGSKVPN